MFFAKWLNEIHIIKLIIKYQGIYIPLPFLFTNYLKVIKKSIYFFYFFAFNFNQGIVGKKLRILLLTFTKI